MPCFYQAIWGDKKMNMIFGCHDNVSVIDG